ncbi:threonine synthase [Streptomyces sp. WM6372]|uniref:threonine synthase n=1 Tax=Streptomyces sp. WM6372 TaxID=1415555 RepID=UPI0006AE7A8E|nr:pyridoxal-phosphate dependent enzyme [Streptomyces sp. WM6372]
MSGQRRTGAPNPGDGKDVRAVCVRCGTARPYAVAEPRCACGGLLDPEYDLATARVRQDAETPSERYFDLLPLRRPESALHIGDGNTPCVHARGLGARLGLDHLYLKDETRNATRTTKDRMAACVLAVFQEQGVFEFVASSTGNSSTSFAWGLRHIDGMKAHLFAGRDFLDRHQYTDHPGVELHVIDDDFVAAAAAGRAFAAEHGLLFEGGFFNSARREGLKLAYLEAYDEMPLPPAVVFQAVSSGMGVYGAHKGAREYLAMGRLPALPRFVCVQQDSCAPMWHAARDGSDRIQPQHILRHPRGLAKAILRGDPTNTYPYMRAITDDTGGRFAAVSDDEMIRARRWLAEDEGIEVCFAAAAALAGAAQLADRGEIGRDEPVLVNLTGGERDEQADD